MADSMTVCDRCGSAVKAGTSVCPNCGAPLGGVDDQTVSGVPLDAVARPAPLPEMEQTPASPDAFSGGTQPPIVEPEVIKEPTLSEVPSINQGPAVFNTPASASAGGFRSRVPWIVSCCLGMLLLGCLILIAVGALFGSMPWSR